MDPDRFDALARFLSRPVARRGALAAADAAALARLGVEDAPGAAKERGAFQRGPCGNGGPTANACRRNADCFTGVCARSKQGKRGKRPLGRCRCRRRGQRCAATRNCCRGRGQDLACVDGRCRPATCAPDCAGKCGGADDDCGGTCAGDCAAGEACCGGRCVRLGTDANCAACADACGASEACCGGECVELGSGANCSACGDACGAGEMCCGATCATLGTDDHCAGCGDACGADQRCCNGACTDIGTDANCGDCGDVCPVDAACHDGRCARPAEQAVGCPIQRQPDGQSACFWMVGLGDGGDCWVLQAGRTQAHCQELDSCGAGGGGQSGGGCYKWARSSCDRINPPW